jgi:hypothetical protein
VNVSDFSPFGLDAIILTFPCNNCGAGVDSDPINLPEPDYTSDTAHDSTSMGGDIVTCPVCGEEYPVNVYVSYAGGTLEIEELPSDAEVGIQEIPIEYSQDELDAILSNTSFHSTFEASIRDVQRLNTISIHQPDLESAFRRQLFVGAISCLEAYLSDALINSILADREALRRFVQSFDQFQQEKIPVSKVFEAHGNIESKVKRALLELIYHNLPRLRVIYRSALAIEFPDVSPLMRDVGVRHDIVHRNGRSKDGKEIEMNRHRVDDLISKVRKFVEEVDKQLP